MNICIIYIYIYICAIINHRHHAIGEEQTWFRCSQNPNCHPLRKKRTHLAETWHGQVHTGLVCRVVMRIVPANLCTYHFDIRKNNMAQPPRDTCGLREWTKHLMQGPKMIDEWAHQPETWFYKLGGVPCIYYMWTIYASRWGHHSATINSFSGPLLGLRPYPKARCVLVNPLLKVSWSAGNHLEYTTNTIVVAWVVHPQPLQSVPRFTEQSESKHQN